MAEAQANTDVVHSDATTIPNLGSNPIFKQIGAMVGIAISVALGVAVVLWTQTPSYSLLDTSISERDSVEVMDVLTQNNIKYKIDTSSGALLVEGDKTHEAKIKLAAAGLPRSSGMGFELMTSDPGFGVSQLVEKARHQRAIEGELARTIATINSVQSARVHLAIPKQSVFIRKRKIPSASVTLKLFSGRKLQQEQIDAIVHMVASSVSELEAEHVTVVDQRGNLLSSRKGSQAMQLSASQFDYTNKVEERYRERVYDILVPILGEEKVRVQVAADIDFTVTEQTRESFNPDMQALRSEQLNEQSNGIDSVGGVPGALSNQPPAAGNAPEVAGTRAGAEGQGTAIASSRQATRNYELDKTVSHTRLSPANVRKLSVAVVIDDKVSLDEQGVVQRVERTPEEIERIAQLVREAIGFDGVRGDTVKVINSSFMAPAPIEDLPEVPMWEEAWFWDIIKQAGGILVVVLLIFLVLKPAMKRLTSNEVAMLEGGMVAGGRAAAGGVSSVSMTGEGGAPALGVDEHGEPIKLPGPRNYESILDAARKLVDEDPKRVAQLVKSWNSE